MTDETLLKIREQLANEPAEPFTHHTVRELLNELDTTRTRLHSTQLETAKKLDKLKTTYEDEYQQRNEHLNQQQHNIDKHWEHMKQGTEHIEAAIRQLSEVHLTLTNANL
jgi:uncharacterized phage infection (PIP) family protein YhgE